MKYPEPLKNGSLIKIISPSNGLMTDKSLKALENAKKFFLKMDLKIEEDKYVKFSNNGVSSNAVNRSKELNENVKNKKNNALIACSGGDYLIEILDKVDWSCFNNNLKWIQGQSDITNLLYYITTKYDIATVYNFNIKKYGDGKVSNNILENSILFLKNKPPKQIILSKDFNIINQFEVITGRIIGGCLDSLKDIIGTNFDCTNSFINKYKKNGIIWYFDIANMTNEDIIRTMWQFKHAGWFKHCKCILFGKLYEEITYTNIELKNALSSSLLDLNIPIIYNLNFGHKNPFITFVNGSIVKVVYNKYIEIETYYI